MHSTNHDILRYLPQRPPFVLVDTLLPPKGAVINTAFTVPGDHVLVEDGFLSASGLVENMAQTAAAGSGAQAALSEKPSAVGFIGAIKNLVVRRLPAIGDVLHTSITAKNQVGNASIVRGAVCLGDEEIASCELTIFLQG